MSFRVRGAILEVLHCFHGSLNVLFGSFIEDVVGVVLLGVWWWRLLDSKEDLLISIAFISSEGGRLP